MAPVETSYDVADREYDEAMREVNDTAIVTISDAEIEFYARQEDVRIMAQAALQDVHQQNPIQSMIQYLFPNRAQVYSREYHQQRHLLNLMDFLSPPQQLLQRQHSDVIPTQVPSPQQHPQVLNSFRQSLSPIQNQQLDMLLARKLSPSSSASSSFNLERE
jgi:hypothetical protein